MSIEITKESREQLIASIQRYFTENMDEPIGNLGANALLNFFIDELAPLAYNQGVAAVQQSLQARIAEIDMEVYADEFQHWGKQSSGRKKNN